MTQIVSIEILLDRAVRTRAELFDEKHETAFRLFNGFLEGCADLVVDLYARTLVIYNYADEPAVGQPIVDEALHFLLQQFGWVQAVVVKTRNAVDEQTRRGRLVSGQAPDRKICEHGVWYAVDLTLNLDASLYLDTRNLRAWAIDHLADQRVLNTFAYTGSLGVAAMAGRACQVVQLDLNRRFLNLAKESYTLNGFPIQRSDFLASDFWVQVNQLKRSGNLYNCVFVDPPFFSTTAHGKVDLVSESYRVINKVRPLVAHDGWLIAINNALFLSGADYFKMLQDLCADGFLSIETLIPVPPDFTGFSNTQIGQPLVDPAPFNHATKIAILRVRRKDQRTV